MKVVTLLALFCMFLGASAIAQSRLPLNPEYGWCPPAAQNRTITLCNPPNNVSETGYVTIRAAIRDTAWPITLEIFRNGQTIGGPDSPGNEDIEYEVPLDPVSTPQQITLRVTDPQGTFERDFTVSNPQNAPCPPSSQDPALALCAPVNNSSSASPVHVAATVTDSSPNNIDYNIYIDGTKFSVGPTIGAGPNNHYFEDYVQLYPGKHRVTVQAHEHNSVNVFYQSSAYVNVTGPAGCPPLAPPSVHICSPTSNPAAGAPLHVVAKGYDSYSIRWMQVYVDGKVRYTARNDSIDTNIPITSGPHKVTVQMRDWAGAGAVYQSSVSITAP